MVASLHEQFESLAPVVFSMAVKWAAVKAFYFRNENVILRLPFSLCLQLAAYFVEEAKGEGEDTKTLYETVGT